MNAWSAILYPALLGTLTLYVLLKDRVPSLGFLMAALGLPMGLGIVSILIFISYLLSPAHASLLMFCLVSTLGLALTITAARMGPAASSATTIRRPSAPELLAFLLLLLCLIRFYQAASATALHFPWGEWDARLFWNVKAKFYLREPVFWQRMFSPLLAWAHPDYPLLLPGSIAWGWQWCGSESLLWPHLAAASFSLSMAGLIAWYLAVYHRPVSGLLAAAFLVSLDFFRYWSASQLADIPLACLITGAAVLAAVSDKNRDARIALTAGFLAGLAAWTKNEGLFFTGFLFVWFGLSDRKEKQKKNRLLPALAGAALPLLAVFVLKAYLAPHGDYLGSGKSLAEHLRIIASEHRTSALLNGAARYLMDNAGWQYLWLMTAAAGCWCFVFKKCRGGSVFGAFTGLQLAGYLTVMHFSPHPPVWQLETAFVRLLLHLSGLAVLFVFSTLGPAALPQTQD